MSLSDLPREPVSVVVSATNDTKAIDAGLAFIGDLEPGEADVVVVTSGSTGRAPALQAFSSADVRVVEVAAASTAGALNAGDRGADDRFPRIYLNVDATLDAATVRALRDVLRATTAPLLAAPQPRYAPSGRPWSVRAFCRISEQMSQANGELVGLGVFAVNAAGRARFGEFPGTVAADLFVQRLFSDEERLVLSDHSFDVRPPSTLGGLLAARTRAARDNVRLAASGDERCRHGDSSTARGLVRLVTRRPSMAPAALVYAGVVLAAHLRARLPQLTQLRARLAAPSSKGTSGTAGSASALGAPAVSTGSLPSRVPPPAPSFAPRQRTGRAAVPAGPHDPASGATPTSAVAAPAGAAPAARPATNARLVVGGVAFDPVTEHAVAQRVTVALDSGRGGWIATANVDHLRQARDPEVATLFSGADVVTADGMPVVWLSRLLGHPLPDRVTGASLVWRLAEAAARTGRSLMLLGGAPGVAEEAAHRLRETFPGLGRVTAYCPPLGFDRHPAETARAVAAVKEAGPDLVFVALGAPRQERFIRDVLVPALPSTWFLGCGGALTMAAGRVSRAPGWVQRAGLEWVHRLAKEPRRLAHRYLVEDLPTATRLLTGALAHRAAGRPAPLAAPMGSRVLTAAARPPVPAQAGPVEIYLPGEDGPVERPSVVMVRPRPAVLQPGPWRSGDGS